MMSLYILISLIIVSVVITVTLIQVDLSITQIRTFFVIDIFILIFFYDLLKSQITLYLGEDRVVTGIIYMICVIVKAAFLRKKYRKIYE